jgi:hypothetical protein
MLSGKPVEEISKIDVITLALEDAGGSIGRVDTEDVAVAAYRLAPNYFSWRKHQEHIDLDLVRMTLRHATERGYGSRVGGSIKSGWHLTARGLQWLSDNGGMRRKLSTPGRGSERGVAQAVQTSERPRDLDRIRHSEAFTAWKERRAVTPRAAAAAFRIDGYTPGRERTFLVAQVVRSAQSQGDKELTRFLLAMEQLALGYKVPGSSAEPERSGE